MKFKINTDPKAVAESSGGAFMSSSGVYDATINFASIAVSKNGAESVNFNFDYNGNPVTIYGPYVTSTAGDPLEIGMNLINKLGVIAGLGDGDELDVEEETHKVGKDQKPMDFSVITNFSDLPVKVRVQEEYNINPNNDEIRKSMVIKSFFREDGASAEEIINETEVGKRLALEEEKYASNITFRDGLTPEDVDQWKKDRAANAKAGGGAAKSTPKTKAAKGGLFKG